MPRDLALAEQFDDALARLVVPDHAQQPSLRAERGRVARDVRRAAETVFLRCTCTTGTGASGEMRLTSPNQ